MSDPFIAEVRIMACNFAPRGWAFCDGQLLPISQNTALFSLIGTTYGGDGRTTTALPNLVDRMPMHPGNGPGLTPRRLGERVGVNAVTLTEAQIPSHTHQVMGNKGTANHPEPNGQELAKGNTIFSNSLAAPIEQLASNTLQSNGGGQSHSNQSPYLNLNFVIALVGTYPSRS